ncbi:hypothetical protein [Rhizosphaericola mali]|uniref:BamA/TamA family outer membrane protein n=1 Tax=Rhizosphaericola mali TaxID=2545455 RepID=A0A5P2FUN8_9BACT|nr:hypothetical protein [Rhizosphaericola mali]QES87176.1 hypothetical protein E0W69_000325 [Rhizosphaericola mali]
MSQTVDTTHLQKTENHKNPIFKKLSDPFTKHNVTVRDTASTLNLTLLNNQLRFSRYLGKVIRNIKFTELNFYQNMEDSTQKKKYFGTNILTKLHRMSRPSVIKKNLFFHSGEQFYPTVIADNERFYRTIPFIRDARIIVDTIPGNSDSIDITVVTKDLFSITGSIGSLSASTQRFTVAEMNLGGLGQSIQYMPFIDNGRKPRAGAEFTYRYYNLFGSFADMRIMASSVGKNIVTGDRNEESTTFELSRPLVSQYKKFTGGLILSKAKTHNVYSNLIEDGRYYKYNYTTFDIWGGINLGIKKYLTDERNRARTLLSVRYMKYTFHNAPTQITNGFNYMTDSRQGALAQLTFFKQNFYQTRYFYGFGTTEDIPYGHSYSLIGGWFRQLNTSRPYIGWDLNKYNLSSQGDILQYFLKGGTFIQQGLRDFGYIMGATFYSRVIYRNQTKIRQIFRFSYSEIINRRTLDPLKINNSQYGLRNFGLDSTIGSRRLTFHSETIAYTPKKIFGFLIAPFMAGDLSLLTPPKGNLQRTALYTGFGPGFRIRNENLVFGTIEVRSLYFPKRVPGLNQFKIGMTANLRFRFNTNYVNKPDIVQLNSDPYNSIY